MKNILKFALFKNVVHSMKFGDVHVSSIVSCSVGDRRSEKNLDCDPIAKFKNLQSSMMPSNLILFKKNVVKYKISAKQSK